jgi:hypothetical protein
MKLFHVTAKGNLHFQLANGRLAAVYPTTGYVRVSGSLKNFIRPEFEERKRQLYNDAVANKNPGSIVMYQINPKREIAVYRRAFVAENRLLSDYNLYRKDSSYQRELYPNDIVKLMDLLVAFEEKNCTGSTVANAFYLNLAKQGRITINKWPC